MAAAAVLSPPCVAQLPRVIRLWHLCSLDAPTIAVVWCAALGQHLGTAVPLPVMAALFCTVWGVYAGDRRLGARHVSDEEDCHSFQRRHSGWFLTGFHGAAFLLAISLLVAALTHASRSLLWASAVLPLLAAYLALEHGSLASTETWKAIKPYAIAVLFAAGVTLPAAALNPHSRTGTAIAFLAYAALVRLNLWAIAESRQTVPRQAFHDRASADRSYVLRNLAVFVLPIGFGFWGCLVLIGLLLHDASRSRAARAALDRRILPDLPLLLPAVLLFAHLLRPLSLFPLAH